MRRREFITLLGSVAAWPHIARAQQSERFRVVCFLGGLFADMPIAKAEETAFLEGLQQLGWTPGRDVRMEIRWSGGDEAKARKQAAELIALVPDVIACSLVPELINKKDNYENDDD
jgi:putative ABC transport system substrate-binding protein